MESRERVVVTATLDGTVELTNHDAAGSAMNGPHDGVWALCRGIVDERGAPVSEVELTRRMRLGVQLDRLGAPFAALLVEGAAVTVAADHVGFRHLYGVQRPGWAAMATSARELAARTEAPLDHDALGVYRMVGHYLDESTAFQGVRKLPAAHLWRLHAGELHESPYEQNAGPAVSGDPAEPHGRRLRELVDGFLDSHDNVVIELSGGLDSRLVLAAVSPKRRAKLGAFTIVAAGRSDGPVAAMLAEHYGMRHQMVSLDGLAALTATEAYAMVTAAAVRQDGLGAPLSAAAFGWAEDQVDPSPRLSGHGGEMARGSFQQHGSHPAVRPELVDRLAGWWLYSNYAVADEALDAEFAASSRQRAQDQLREIFSRYGTDWITATDRFSLTQRLHRWAGITITDGCRARVVLNPLLDRQVLALGQSEPSRLRIASRYAARVLDQLDPELARLPLGSGLRPVVLSRQLTLSRRLNENSVRGFVGKAASKVASRVLKQRRPSVGATALAPLVVAHWRAEPHLLEGALKTGLIREEWVSRLLAGEVGADVPTVDFLVNLTVLTS